MHVYVSNFEKIKSKALTTVILAFKLKALVIGNKFDCGGNI